MSETGSETEPKLSPVRPEPRPGVTDRIHPSVDAGEQETGIIEILNGEWTGVTVDTLAPDGETVLGRIVFNCCPVCQAMVAPGNEVYDFPMQHAETHVIDARVRDALDRRMDQISQAMKALGA